MAKIWLAGPVTIGLFCSFSQKNDTSSYFHQDFAFPICSLWFEDQAGRRGDVSKIKIVNSWARLDIRIAAQLADCSPLSPIDLQMIAGINAGQSSEMGRNSADCGRARPVIIGASFPKTTSL